MARMGMRSRSARSVVDKGLLLKRIRELERVINVYDVACLVGNLRELNQEYANKKLIPFTHCVERALRDYQERAAAAYQKEIRTATPSNRSSTLSSSSSEGSPSSSSAGSQDEEDMLKTSIREAYKKSGQQKREKDAQKDNSQARDLMKMSATSGLSDCRGSESNIPMFRDFGGMDDIIDVLMTDVVIPLCRPELPNGVGARPLSGILLHGPPGCGKTRLAQAIGNEAGVPVYEISSTDIISGVIGRSEENLRGLFRKAHRTAPSIVFIDEIDVIGSKRENHHRDMEKQIVTQLISCMNGPGQSFQEKDGNMDQRKPGHVLVIGATNDPNSMDPALRRPGRFSREIYLGPPSEQSRKEILMLLTEKIQLQDSLDISRIARGTSGFVGADLVELVDMAGTLAMRRIITRRKMEISDELTKEQKRNLLKQPWIPSEIHKPTMVDFEEAIKLVQPSLKREGFSSIPDVKWEDVGGLESLREKFFFDIIQRVRNPEYEVPGIHHEIGFLLYGPPGCGKTLIAQAVANESGANFIYIKGPELLNKYVGESERAVRMLFMQAKRCSPCILFFDEIDALASKRSNDDSVSRRVLTQLLIELDGFYRRSGVVIIGATNKPEDIDGAILRPGRLGEKVYVPLPSSEERGLILKTLTKKITLDVDIDLRFIARDCKNFSGADLASLVYKTWKLAFKEKNKPVGCMIIKTCHFEQARLEIKPSVSEKERNYFENLSKNF